MKKFYPIVFLLVSAVSICGFRSHYAMIQDLQVGGGSSIAATPKIDFAAFMYEDGSVSRKIKVKFNQVMKRGSAYTNDSWSLKYYAHGEEYTRQLECDPLTDCPESDTWILTPKHPDTGDALVASRHDAADLYYDGTVDCVETTGGVALSVLRASVDFSQITVNPALEIISMAISSDGAKLKLEYLHPAYFGGGYADSQFEFRVQGEGVPRALTFDGTLNTTAHTYSIAGAPIEKGQASALTYTGGSASVLKRNDPATYLATFAGLTVTNNVSGSGEVTYWHMNVNGSGCNSGSTGKWKPNCLPKTKENAMSLSNFHNLANNWDTEKDNPDKLDSNDVVLVHGEWPGGNNINVPHGITLDFYGDSIDDNPDYDPQTGFGTLPIFYSQLYINVDNVTIQDGRFNGGGRSVIVNDQHNLKLRNINIIRNKIELTLGSAGWCGLFMGFVCDSEIAYNFIGKDNASASDCCSGTSCPDGSWISQAVSLQAGSRNKIHHNHIKGGKVGIFLPGSMTWDHDKKTMDYPSSGSHTIDPDVNYVGNEIAYNYLELRCQEGISLDIAGARNEAWGFSIVERDTVASIHGTTVTLDNSGGEWSGIGNQWSGLYMLALADRDDTFGNHALIESQSANSFTLSNTIANLQIGDQVVIGTVAKRNWIHHNQWGPAGFQGSSQLLEGCAVENRIEENTFPNDWSEKEWRKEGFGVSTKLLYGWLKSPRSLTGAASSGVTAYNIIRNNKLERILNMAHDKGAFTSDDFTIRNNAFYDNIFYVSAANPRKITLKRANAYLNNNKYADGGDVIVDTSDGLSGLRATDPTGFVLSDWEIYHPNPITDRSPPPGTP